ncbi:MAG: ribosome-associated translation inhibitor RaiA [Acidimicrobiia bacterium]|nr:ribosome-associated translation inhibitor RaiA [Acidimicrobiia bacterium]
MDVQVHGKNTQVTDAMRSAAEEKVRHAGRIFGDGANADVEFTEWRNPRVAGRFRVEITTRAKGHTVRVEASAGDDRSALDLAVDKFEHQLRRLKERLVQRSRPHGGPSAVPDVDAVTTAGSAVLVRTKRFELRPMSVEEATLQIDLLGHAFFFFHDAETGKPSVLYHRKDGSLGLIVPA